MLCNHFLGRNDKQRTRIPAGAGLRAGVAIFLRIRDLPLNTRDFTYEDLLKIVDLIKSSSRFAEFHLKVGDIELDLKRGSSAPPHATVITMAAVREDAAVRKDAAVRQGAGAAADPSPELKSAPRASPLAYPDGAILIKSPMVGTFYRAPEPGAKPFVEVGEIVEAATIVGIVEVMKLMNSIPAGHQGVVTHILVEDAEPVQYGQVIIVLEPGPTA